MFCCGCDVFYFRSPDVMVMYKFNTEPPVTLTFSHGPRRSSFCLCFLSDGTRGLVVHILAHWLRSLQ